MDISSALQIQVQQGEHPQYDTVRKLTHQDGMASLSAEKLEEVSNEFESMFIKMMLGSMRKTLNKKDDMSYGGMSEDIFEDMLYDKYASIMAKHHSFGISEMIQEQYEKHTGKSTTSP